MAIVPANTPLAPNPGALDIPPLGIPPQLL
jgi:hypothetical protein